MLNWGQEGPFERTKKMFFVTRTRLNKPSLDWSKSMPASHWYLWVCSEQAMDFYRDCHHGTRGLILLFREEKNHQKVKGRKSTTGLFKL